MMLSSSLHRCLFTFSNLLSRLWGRFLNFPHLNFAHFFSASHVVTAVKNPPANAGDTGDTDPIPGSRKSPGEGSGNPLKYYFLAHFMDRGAWQAPVHGVAKSQAQLSMFLFKFYLFCYNCKWLFPLTL